MNWSLGKPLLVAGVIALTSSCSLNPLNKHAGTYCLIISSLPPNCLYLKENGTGMVDSFTGGADIEWELLGENKLKVVNAFTGSGTVLTITDNGKSLTYYNYIANMTYKKQVEPSPNHESAYKFLYYAIVTLVVMVGGILFIKISNP